MQALTLDTLSRSTAAMLITGYQKYLSPHKGFSCAHRVWHRGESCSQYTKRAIVERGLIAAIPLVRERFQECKVANERLQQRRQARQNICHHQAISLSDSLARIDSIEEDVEPTNKRERERQKSSESTSSSSSSSSSSCNGNGLDCCTGVDCGSVDCGNVGTCDRHALHCPTIDCGAIDCAGADCGAMDCDCGGLDCSGCDACSGCSW
jgi:putative component of membrane protein insertase Oxa1/YidC/SpoIIIJ protein YidD